MSTGLMIPLHNRQQAWTAIRTLLFPFLAQALQAEREWWLQVKPKTRSLEQNAKFHAMCEDFERCKVEWAGKPRTSEEWKVLLVSGHAVATRGEAEVVEGLEGELVNIRESTAQMSVGRGSSLIEYTHAAGAGFGVKFKEQA